MPNKPSFGLILNGTVGYTSDCTYSRERIEWLLGKGCEVIYHDVYFGPYFPGTVHTAYEQMTELPYDVASKVVLMHYNDNVTDDQIKAAQDAGFRLAGKHETYHHGE